MSVAALSEPRVRPASRLWTAADLDALPNELDGKAVKYELYDGELIVMAPPGGEHGRRQHKVGRALDRAEEMALGVAYGEVGIVLRRNPDRIVGADAAFVLSASLPVQFSREGYLTTIPEIIVEVQSKNDSDAAVQSKSLEYFEAGARMVWRINSQSKAIMIATIASERTLNHGETLTCDLLPGFAVPVKTFFE